MAEPQDWTLFIAGYAALVSTGLLALRIWELALARGWVKVSTSFHPATDTLPAFVAVALRNKGLGDATVTRLDLIGPGPVRIYLSGTLITSGPELPFKLEAGASQTWLVDANKLKTVLRENGWHYQVRGMVTLATGKNIWESIHKFTTVH